MKFILSMFITIIFSINCLAQNAVIKDVKKMGDKLHVTYKLDKGKYKVTLKAKTSDGNRITAKSVSGDVGNSVKGGGTRYIIWLVLEDYTTLDIEDLTIETVKIDGR